MNENKNYQQKILFDKSNISMDNSNRKIIVNKAKFLETLKNLQKIDKLQEMRHKLMELRNNLVATSKDRIGILNIDTNGDTIKMSYNYIMGEIKQIEEAQTLERARYYLDRLKKALTETKTNKVNDINLNRWKEYNEIITDSLWVLDKRDTSGAHLGWYWGNFIPQIPHQMMLRYTKKGDWVLDPFVGSGTTLIECKRLGRNGIGIELNPEVVKKAKQLIEKELNRFNVCDRK